MILYLKILLLLINLSRVEYSLGASEDAPPLFLEERYVDVLDVETCSGADLYDGLIQYVNDEQFDLICAVLMSNKSEETFTYFNPKFITSLDKKTKFVAQFRESKQKVLLLKLCV